MVLTSEETASSGRVRQVRKSLAWTPTSNLNDIRDGTEEPTAMAGGLMMGGPIPIVTPHFSHLESKILEYLDQSTYVLGCAAWLTNHCIMNALERRAGVKIVVNKEPYLVRDDPENHHLLIRRHYQKLPPFRPSLGKDFQHSISHWVEPDRLSGLEIAGAVVSHGDPDSTSRMHNKFLIFLDDRYRPLGVWTGSYNLTANSNYSLENAVYLTDLWVCREYLREFFLILSHSHPIPELKDP